MTGPDCAVIMRNLINTHTHTHTHKHTHTISIIDPPREDQCEWHRMTRKTRPDCVVMRNLINTHTHTHQKGGNQEVERAAQGAGVTERLYGKIIFNVSYQRCS